MTLAEIANLRRLMAAATPEPWEIARYATPYVARHLDIQLEKWQGEAFNWEPILGSSMGGHEANAALIVAAVNALPALLDEANEAVRWRKMAAEYLKDWNDGRAERDALKAEVERIANDVVVRLVAERDTLKTEVEKLRERLFKSSTYDHEGETRCCTCGAIVDPESELPPWTLPCECA